MHRNMLLRSFTAVAFVLGVSQPEIVFALEASGKAAAVVPATAASGTGGSRTLIVDGPVFMGDVVKTDAGGSAQIKFVDNTKLVVGPNSQVTIDSFVFQNASTAKSFSLNAVQGSFRFITGVSAKNAYTINTPTATIGVRGTEFDFAVDQEGTHLGLWGGTVRLCNKAVPRQCTDVSGQCSVVVVTPDKKIKAVKSIYERTSVMQELFPFAFRQHKLKTEFRVESGSCDVQNLDPAPGKPGGEVGIPEPPSESTEGGN